MVMVNVQFYDSNETAISAYFASPQDPTVHPNLGAVADSDSRWKDFYQTMKAANMGLEAGLPGPTTAQ